MDRLYFDYNASAPLAAGLASYLKQWLDLDPKNPSSAHAEGRTARALIDEARRGMLQLLGGDRNVQLVFTSGGTEANNTVLASAMRQRGDRTTLLMSAIEHSSVRKTAQLLASQGVRVVTIPVDAAGNLDVPAFSQLLTNDVFLISVMLANNETGFVLPVEELAGIANKRRIPFHTDAVCAVGKVAVDFQALGCSYLTFSSHKFGGLKGSGGILYKTSERLAPLIVGGPHEAERRAGTENVLGILAAAEALHTALDGLDGERKRQEDLRERLKQALTHSYPAVRVMESFARLPQTLSVAFPGVAGTLLIANLDLEGVAVSHGSACASGALETSPVLLAMGLERPVADAAVRISFGRQTTMAEIDALLLRLRSAIERATS